MMSWVFRRLGACSCAVMVVASVLVTGCTRSSPPEVVVYAALDKELSEPILADFTRETGIRVRAKYDVESTKTLGLYHALRAERNRPRCDVFWNNEIIHTLRLAEAGLLDAHVPPSAAEFPASARDPQGRWHAFAARARVLLVNRDLLPQAEHPRSIRDLIDSRFRGRIGIAKPLFGSTASHAACLFAAWGDDEARAFFRALKANGVQVLSGNRQVAQAVGIGQLLFGLTDTDDAIGQIEAGRPVVIVYPDRLPDELGTLFLPNTLAVIRGGPNRDSAHRLVDYLLTASVEERLARGLGAQIPLSSQASREACRVETPATVKAMVVDFARAADRWENAAAFLRDEFTGAE